jgi:ATP-dependent exoDNAse (exonuclease V) beta subunit
MQSIYFFRQAETELFTRVRNIGLEIPLQPPLPFDFVPLTANFRTVPDLVLRLNRMFDEIFAVNDGSSVAFTSAVPAVALGGPTRSQAEKSPHSSFNLHLNFEPQATRNKASDATTARERDEARENQTKQIVELIESHAVRMGQARANGEKYRIAVLARSAKSLNCLVPAMRDAGIPFRAIGIEGLGARQEVLDALALGCALLNPHDRVAWLGVLRAPWCGLSLDDLHQLTSADDPELMTRPIPELFAERAQLLSRGGKIAACRVQAACDRVRAFRSSSPGALPGTWLQQIWLSLGGADCCDANALANLELLWTCLDRQPGGEQDLLGQALTTALDNLTALPDPAAASDCGVQLMTIHKSKGLEFEVVIVPDLQARVGGGEPKMLSWLERGLAEPDESGEMTEFLIAPRQSKGAERGGTKAWVDRVYTGREWQDERRILYVAATRARTELHLFARPCFKVEQDHSLTLLNPNRSLLAIAWPALEGKIQSRFDEWKSARPAAEAYIESIAASGESNLLVMASATHPAKPTLLRRLPDDYRPPLQALVESSAEAAISGIGGSRLYTRHEGGLVSRALGTAVHTLFEELARLRAAADWPQARAALGHCQPRVAAQIRACCVDQAQAAKLAAEALELALAASNDPVAQWILSPHAEAASEARWAGVVNGGLSTVRVDRMFRAGPSPLVDGQDAWWIIDYKTAHADVPDPAAALPELRKLFAPQIDAYAQVLRNLHGANVVLLAGLYYPRMLTLDWWEI